MLYFYILACCKSHSVKNVEAQANTQEEKKEVQGIRCFSFALSVQVNIKFKYF